tara:strand:- start:2247 stop:3080 length:834 start_codon:yes stop_codon:yes gene_type:complete
MRFPLAPLLILGAAAFSNHAVCAKSGQVGRPARTAVCHIPQVLKDRNDECRVEPKSLSLQPVYSKQPMIQKAVERAVITVIATGCLAMVLPPIKTIGLLGRVSCNHDIRASIQAIGPIVAFTANMPALLENFMQAIPGFKDLPENSKVKIIVKVAILASIKHVWVWPHENKLNNLSIGGNSLLPQNPKYIRRFSHTCREAVLIMCVGQQACRGVNDQFLAYGNKALIQTAFDRIAFRTNINPMYTFLSRALYLAAVKEVIERTSKSVANVINKPKET